MHLELKSAFCGATLIGLAVALSTVLSPARAVTALAQPPNRVVIDGYPVQARNLITISDETVTGQVPGNFTVQGVGQTRVVYQVPTNQWLVINSWKWSSTPSDIAYIVENVGGTLTPKFSAASTATSIEIPLPLGWAFRPGSTVEILAPRGGVQNISFDFIGYLQRDREH